ncbi:MAG: isoprenylcysteine carboxylmethyltransferase family protein [Steroidobacteraceae bacterium]
MNLREFYQTFFSVVWLAWVIAWWVFALNVKATVRRQAALPRLLNMALLFCAVGLLFWAQWAQLVPVRGLTERFLPGSEWRFWAALGAALTLIGLLFTVWARVYLGRNWSGTAATIKADHELVTGGPYGLVRHPIYSGLMLAFVGTALAIGQWRGVLAVALALVAIVHRIIVEERFMREQFGAAYDTYTERVRAIVPGLI